MADTSGPVPPIRVRRNRGVDVVITTADGTVIMVHPFPEDGHVAADIERVATRLGPNAAELAQLREELETALRAWYPRITIRPREAIASLSQAEHVWYAMRDGRIHPTDSRLDRLHAAMATARDTKHHAVEAVTRARDLVGAVPRRRSGLATHDEKETGDRDPNA